MPWWGVRFAVCAVVVLAGCVILPDRETTRKTVGSRVVDSVGAQRDAIALELVGTQSTVVVRARWERDCERTTYELVEERREPDTEFDSLVRADDFWTGVFVFFGSFVTLPATALVTAAVNLLSSESVTRKEVRRGAQTFACNVVAADVPVAVMLPSGQRLVQQTNAHGAAIFTVPFDEPRGFVVGDYAGRVQLARALRYEIPAHVAPVEERAVEQVADLAARVRAAAPACAAASGVIGRVELRIYVDARGAVEWIERASAEPRFVACVGAAVLDVRAASARGRTVDVTLPLTASSPGTR